MPKTHRPHLYVKRRILNSLWKKEEPNYCFYCHVRLSLSTKTIDHLLPIARGGSNGLGNMRLCCKPCNIAKADLTLAEFVDMCAYLGGIEQVKQNFGNDCSSRRDYYNLYIAGK